MMFLNFSTNSTRLLFHEMYIETYQAKENIIAVNNTGHLSYCHDQPHYFRYNFGEGHGNRTPHNSQITFWFPPSGMKCTKTAGGKISFR